MKKITLGVCWLISALWHNDGVCQPNVNLITANRTTGNRMDYFQMPSSFSYNNSSGTGAFQFFADDTLSMLFNYVSEKSLHQNLFFLAGDKCQGRMTASHGDSVAADYVEQWMKKNKLKPGVNFSYRQQVALIDNVATAENILLDGQTKYRFDHWDYQWPLYAFKKGVDVKNAPLVFINYGIDTKKYKDFDNIDVKGKVVIHLMGSNKFLRDSLISADELKGNMKDYESKGALAAILVPTSFDFETIAEGQRRSNAFKLYTLKSDTASYWTKDQNPFPFIYSSKSFFKDLLGQKTILKDSLMKSTAYLKQDPQAFDLNKNISITIKRELKDVFSPNIIATIEGMDKEAGYIIFTAHRDHEGQAFDSTWYGADDNASGTAAMMECAKAIATLANKGIRPKRGIIFISTTAEEHGLLGASYYTQNPTVPLNKIKYALNIDMLGRIDSKHTDNNRMDTNYVYPLYYDSMYNFKPLLDELSPQTGLITDDYYLKNSTEENMIQRSDHIVFGQKGIPFIWFFTGIHKDYHQATDTPDKIDYGLLAKRTKLALGVLWKLANQ